jgi:hypothetical protein
MSKARIESTMAASFSQSLGTFVIPTAERTDPEPVRNSLAQALADFERGAVRDALRHLRRAAESADDAGNELRAVALARAAADLATEVGTTATPPPPSIAPTALAQPPVGQPLMAPPVPPPPVAPPPALQPPVAQPLVAPPPVAPPPVAAPPIVKPSVAPASSAGGSADEALEQLVQSGRAVKVIVKRSAREEGLYVVRRADGPPTTLGGREAVIVLLDPDESFFTPPPKDA